MIDWITRIINFPDQRYSQYKFYYMSNVKRKKNENSFLFTEFGLLITKQVKNNQLNSQNKGGSLTFLIEDGRVFKILRLRRYNVDTLTKIYSLFFLGIHLAFER